MAKIFDPKYTVIDREEKTLRFTCQRDTDGVIDSVSGSTQITDEYKKIDVQSDIGDMFEAKDAESAADDALIDAFEVATKEYLETRFN